MTFVRTDPVLLQRLIDDLNAYTAENVTLYNTKSVDTARQEAAALQEAYSYGESSDGRTPDEILAQVEKHQDVPTYGAGQVIGLVDALAQIQAENSAQSLNRVCAGVTAATGIVGAVDPRLGVPMALLSGTFTAADAWHSPESTAAGVEG